MGIVNSKSHHDHILARFHFGMDSSIGEISLGDGLLDRGPSRYRSVRLHCGVESSLHARFCGDRPGSYSVIDVTDRQTDQTFIDIEIHNISQKE